MEWKEWPSDEHLRNTTRESPAPNRLLRDERAAGSCGAGGRRCGSGVGAAAAAPAGVPHPGAPARDVPAAWQNPLALAPQGAGAVGVELREAPPLGGPPQPDPSPHVLPGLDSHPTVAPHPQRLRPLSSAPGSGADIAPV